MLAALFRKPKPEPTLRDVIAYMLKSDACTFVRRVRDLFQSLEPGAATMCVVAMANLNVILALGKNLARKHPDKEVPSNLDDFIRLLVGDGWPTDEIQRRRVHWFLFALLARRATDLAEPNSSLHDDIADIWVRLAEGGKYLAALVPENIIWDADEKIWFTDTKSQRDGAKYVVWLMCPYWVKLHPKIGDFADANGFDPI